MRRYQTLTLLTAVLLIVLAQFTMAEVPSLLSYQGRLTDSLGAGLDTTVAATFMICSDSEGVNVVWIESHSAVTITGGLFAVLLGSVNPLESTVFDGSVRWLGVQLAGSEMDIPLIPIVPVAYAHKAAFSDTAAYALAAQGGGSGGGWMDAGTVVHLESMDDSVGIGTSTPTEKLHVEGDALISGKATIGSGHANTGTNAFVAGINNTASGDFACVSGGEGNTASGYSATSVCGGEGNTASEYAASVGGGSKNTASGAGASVGGGWRNSASGDNASVSGGAADTASGTNASVGGGAGNIASGWGSVVSGGIGNDASGYSATVAGGRHDTASGDFAFVGGGVSNTATEYATTVSGGHGNHATASRATIGGGVGNTASGHNAFVGGGEGNTASSNEATVCGGGGNTVAGLWGFIGGGTFNKVSGSRSFIGGGYMNTVLADHSAILIGYEDTITAEANHSFLFGFKSKLTQDSTFMVDMPHIRFGDEATGYEVPSSDGNAGQVMVTDGSGQLQWSSSSGSNWNVSNNILHTNGAWGLSRGGVGNVSYGTEGRTMVNLGWASTAGVDGSDITYATVGGGGGNIASGDRASVVGGFANTASGEGASVGGGGGNTAIGDHATVGGGLNNTASDFGAVVGGGWGDTASGSNSAISGGSFNMAVGDHSVISGGASNHAAGGHSFVGGGYKNTASGYHSSVGGGSYHIAGDSGATVGGGRSNTATGKSSTVAGGRWNDAIGWYASVSGGRQNEASGGEASVGGGSANTASANGTTVCGGAVNTASGYQASVVGGNANTASGHLAFVGSGASNTAIGSNSVVSGGYNNDAATDYSWIGGGRDNATKGYGAAVPGGVNNVAAGDYSLACGYKATARHEGTFVWADASGSEFESTEPNQFLVRATGGTKVYSNADLTAGVTIHAGASAWAINSDRNLKEQFTPVDTRELLDKIASLPITTWSYKSQDESVRHIGPMAQDFSAAFGVGEDDTHISTVDADGVALAAIQALYEKTVALEKANADMAEELRRLRAQIEDSKQ